MSRGADLREEILAMAREAGLQRTNPGEAIEVVRFAGMVAAKEREACAVLLEKRAEQLFAESAPSDREQFSAACEADWCADLIRARGNHG